METTESKAVMPMTTPRTVRKERVLFSRRVVRAIWTFSPRLICFANFTGLLELLAQCFDRGQTGGFPGGIDAEENADGGGNDFRDENGDHRDVHGDGGCGAGEIGDSVGHDHADDAADCGHDGRLDQKLQKDVAVARAERLADTDFAGALGHRGEHHIHDNDAPDDEKHGNDADHGGGDDPGKILPELHERSLIENAEIVRLVGRQVAASAHEGAGFVLSTLHPIGVAGLDIDPDGFIGAVDFEIGLDGDVSEIVLGLAECGTDAFGNADHLEGAAVNENFATDRVDIGEKLRGNVGTYHSDESATLVVTLGDVAAFLGSNDVDIHHVGGDAADAGVVERVGADAGFTVKAELDADAFGEFHVIAKGFKVAPGDFFVAASGFYVFFDVGDDREAGEEEDVGTHVGNAVGDVLVDAGDEGYDDDEGGYGEDDTEKHQKGTHFVGAKGLDGNTDGFAEQYPALHRRALPRDTLPATGAGEKLAQAHREM